MRVLRCTSTLLCNLACCVCYAGLTSLVVGGISAISAQSQFADGLKANETAVYIANLATGVAGFEVFWMDKAWGAGDKLLRGLLPNGTVSNMGLVVDLRACNRR